MSKTTNLVIASILIILTAFLFSTSLATPSEDNQTTLPLFNNGTVTDINNFTYSKQDDGLYKIISENSTTYFGFGISAKTLANNSQKRTTLDFTWSYNKTNTSNGFNIIGNNNANNWITNFSFTNESTKITNMITNNFEFNLHDTKFYYIFSVNVGDNISYRDRNYQVQESSNIHLTNDNLSLNTVATEIKKNNDFYFDYSDIILDGFNVTDIYLTDASFIGAGAGKIIAVGFTKDDGIFSNGETFTIDPKISNKKSYKSVQSNNPKFINNISSDVVFPTKSEMKGKRLHLSPVDKSNHANDVTFKVKTTIFNEISTLQENTFVVWRLDDNGKTISQTVITIDPNSTYTNFKGGFSETVVGGITGQLTKTCTGISSGEACTFDSVNVTKVTVNLTDTSTAYQALLINNTGGSALSDYQINANVTYDSDMQNNFSDLRFRNDTSSENQLYWIESKANGSWANIWINITSIPANSWLNDTIYTYYGNPSVGSASNIDDTMIFGDEYTGITIDTAKWNETDVGSHISQNDKLIFDGGTSTWGQTGIYTDNTFARPFIYQTKWRTSSVTNTRSFGVKDAATSVSYDDFVYLFHADPSAVFKLLEGGSVVKSTDSYTADTDYWLKVEVLSTGAKYYRSTDNENLTLLYTSSYSTESPLKIGATSYQGAQEFDNTFVRKYTSNEPIVTVGIAQNITSNVTAGTDTSSDYNITDGEYSHTMSSVQNINNVTPYWDGYGTATVTITALVIDPIVQLTNITSNGRIFGNSTYPPLVYMENVNITIKKPTTTWDNEGTSTLTTNDVNATNFNFTENATQWTIINTTVNTSIELFYNFTKPVNHNPTGSVSNQGFTTLQDASIIVTRADEDNVNQLTCSATLDGTTIDSCTSPIDFGTKSAGIYTIYWNGTDNNGTLSGTGTSFNETATITITQSVITPFGIRDGVYAIRNNSIPSNATILKNKNNSILTNVVTLNWSSITQNTWDEFLGSVNYAYTKGTRIGIRLNFDGIYTDTDNQNLSKTNITTHFPDTKNDPYESDIQWIEFNFTNSSESFADMGTFANEIAENITEQTNNKFPIYTVQAATGLDSIYVVGVSPIQYIIITNLTTFLDDEASTLRSSISKSRVYSDNESDTVLSTLSSYKTNIRNKLRGSIASTHPTETFAVHINNGSGGNDLILFNNQSTIQNRTVANKTGIWLDTTNDVIKNYLVNTTLGFNVSANSFGYIINENVSKLILNNSNAHDVYGQSITYNQTFTYGDNYNSNYVYAGTNTDLKTMLYDPSYRKTRAITDYGWINSSLETNWSNYDVIILADKNWDELNDTINNDDAVHGYVAVLDYTDSDGYVVSKKAEMDWWLSRGYGIFIDGIDFSISADNFSIRLKELVNHGRVNYSESVILNTYTAYDQFSTYGNRVMKESCFARHNDDLENIIYSMEDITLEKQRADYLSSHNIPVVCQAFGNATNYSKIRYTSLAWAVIYGDDGNNSFYYAQPDFQTSSQVRIQDFGDMLESSYTETSPTDWNRLYSKGRVHINPVTQIGWVDDGKVINDMRLEFYTYSGGTGSGDRNVTFVLQTPDGIQYNFTDDNYEAVWAHRGFSIGKTPFTETGYYPVFIKTRPIAGGWNFIGKTTDTIAGGISSYNDVSGANVPIEGNESNYSWQSLGQDLHWMVRLNINYTVTQKIDTINNSYITQSQSRDATGNTTLNLTTTKDYLVNIYTTTARYITTSIVQVFYRVFGGEWTVGNIPSTNTTDMNATSISWTETTVDGKTFGIVMNYISLNNWDIRILLPDSTSEAKIMTNVLPTISNTSNKTAIEGQTIYIDIDGTDLNSDTLSYSINRTDLFSDFSTSTGQGNWTTTASTEGTYIVDAGISDGIGNTNTTFTITVSNGIPQNLASVNNSDHSHLSWDAVSGASHYNISSLQHFIYYNSTGATIDGLRDSQYNSTAIELMVDTPNPIIPNSSDDFFLFYNNTHIFMYLSGTDNDNIPNDDYAEVYLDLTANGLTTDDYAYKVSESGSLTRLKWSGSAWLTNPGSSANSTATGSSTNNLTFEIEIPLSELSLSNNSNIKLLLERECTSTNPDIETFHPDNNINNTDNSLWLNQTLSPILSWLEVGNSTSPLFEVTSLTSDEHYTFGVNSTVGLVSSDRATIEIITTENPAYNISGTITDSNSNPLNNTSVSIAHVGGVSFAIATSNITGYYNLQHIHNSTGIVTANLTGYNPSSTQITTNGSDTTLNFILHTQINETVLNTESISLASLTQSASTTITSNFTSVNSTITTVTLNITNPNSLTTSYSMTCSTTPTSANCSRTHTTTSIVGAYTINNYTITDSNSLTKTITSSLTFEVTATSTTPASSSTSTSKGSHLPTPIPTTISTSTTSLTKTPSEPSTPFEKFFTPIKNSLIQISENLATTSFVHTTPIPLNEYWKFIALLIGTTLSNLILIKPDLIKPNKVIITFAVASLLTIASSFIIPTYQFFSLPTLFIVGLATGFATVPGKLLINATAITILSLLLITVISSAILLPTEIPSLDTPSYTESKQSIKDSNFRVYPNLENTHIFSAKVLTTEPVNMLEITFRNYPINTDISFITQVNVKATPTLYSGTTLNYIIPSQSTPNFFIISNNIPSPLPSKIIGTHNEQPIHSVTIPNTIQYVGVSLTRTSLFTETTKSLLTPTSTPSTFPSLLSIPSDIISNFINSNPLTHS